MFKEEEWAPIALYSTILILIDPYYFIYTYA